MNISDAGGDIRVNVAFDENEYIPIDLTYRGAPMKGFVSGFSFTWRRPFGRINDAPPPHVFEVQPRGFKARKDGSVGMQHLNFGYDFEGFSLVPPEGSRDRQAEDHRLVHRHGRAVGEIR